MDRCAINPAVASISNTPMPRTMAGQPPASALSCSMNSARTSRSSIGATRSSTSSGVYSVVSEGDATPADAVGPVRPASESGPWPLAMAATGRLARSAAARSPSARAAQRLRELPVACRSPENADSVRWQPSWPTFSLGGVRTFNWQFGAWTTADVCPGRGCSMQCDAHAWVYHLCCNL